MTMMPIVDDNDYIVQVAGLRRQASTTSEQVFSWLDSSMVGGDNNNGNLPREFVDSILAQSLLTHTSLDDVLKAPPAAVTPAATTTTEGQEDQDPLPVPTMTAEDIDDFLLELETMDQPPTTENNQGISVSRDDMFEPIPLSDIQNRYAVINDNTVNNNDDDQHFAKLTVPKADYSLMVPTQYGNIQAAAPAASTKPSVEEDSSSSSSSDDEQSHQGSYCPKFRGYQCDQWQERYQELCEFYDQNGHSSVPHTDSTNKRLARWVKRQRYQYKLRQEGKPSAMTDERIKALEDLKFTWDSHGAAFEDRLKELEEFKARHKHCNVPSNYRANSSLASWVKCQRRQYRLFREGKHSNITQARIDQLERMGFQFNLRVGYHHHHNHHRRSGGWS